MSNKSTTLNTLTYDEVVLFIRSLGYGRNETRNFTTRLREDPRAKFCVRHGYLISYDPARRQYTAQDHDGVYVSSEEVDDISLSSLAPGTTGDLENIRPNPGKSFEIPVEEVIEEEEEEEEEEEARVDPYIYRDGEYICFYKDNTLRVPEKQVERLYGNYTSLGLGLDFETARLDAGLAPEEAYALRHCLHLVKRNVPFPPHLLEKYSDDELLDKTEEFKSERIKKKNIQRRMRTLEKQAEEKDLRRTWLEARIENVEQFLANNKVLAEIEPLEFLNTSKEGPTVFWSMNDEHWGKQPIGDSSYTIDDQYKEMVSTSRRVVQRIQKKAPKEIVMIFGSDMFNIDSVNMTTTRGTAQQNTASVGEIADRMMKYFIQAVTLASTVAPVKLYVVPGNHDRTITYFAGTLLKTIFSTNPNVEVDADEQVRKYHSCGSTLMTLIHGDIKSKDMTAIAYSEAAEKWPNKGFRRHIIIQGHLHRFDLSLNTRSGTQTTTTTAASPKGGWEADRYGRMEDRRVTLYTIFDNEYISGIDFVEVGNE